MWLIKLDKLTNQYFTRNCELSEYKQINADDLPDISGWIVTNSNDSVFFANPNYSIDKHKKHHKQRGGLITPHSMPYKIGDTTFEDIFPLVRDRCKTIDIINPLGTFGESEQGKKSDNNKPPMELLPSNGLIEVAKAMGYGAKKYNESWPDMNWPKVKNAKRRYLGAALRHIMARLGGEVRDPESGELHVAHAAFCLLALCEFDGGYRKESK